MPTTPYNVLRARDKFRPIQPEGFNPATDTITHSPNTVIDDTAENRQWAYGKLEEAAANRQRALDIIAAAQEAGQNRIANAEMYEQPMQGDVKQPQFPPLSLPTAPTAETPRPNDIASLAAGILSLFAPQAAGQFANAAMSGAIKATDRKNAMAQQRYEAEYKKRLQENMDAREKEEQRVLWETNEVQRKYRNDVASAHNKMQRQVAEARGQNVRGMTLARWMAGGLNAQARGTESAAKQVMKSAERTETARQKGVEREQKLEDALKLIRERAKTRNDKPTIRIFPEKNGYRIVTRGTSGTETEFVPGSPVMPSGPWWDTPKGPYNPQTDTLRPQGPHKRDTPKAPPKPSEGQVSRYAGRLKTEMDDWRDQTNEERKKLDNLIEQHPNWNKKPGFMGLGGDPDGKVLVQAQQKKVQEAENEWKKAKRAYNAATPDPNAPPAAPAKSGKIGKKINTKYGTVTVSP